VAGGATTVPEDGATTTKFRPVVERRRSPRAARAAQIAGVIGVIVCLILALVVWLGRGAVHGALDDLATSVDGGFDRAVTAIQSVSDQINAAGTQVGSIAADADAIVGKVASTDAISRLTTRLASFADSYRTIRTRYAEARENLTAAVTSVQRVARLVPGERVPDGAGDRLMTMDAKLQAIDDGLTSTWTVLSSGQVGDAAAAGIATQAHAIQDRLSDAATTVSGLAADIQGAQTRAADTIGSIQTILLVATIALTLFFVWILVLNVALWQLGRIWQRDANAQTGATASSAAAEPSTSPAP
jgi:predicted RecB family endonuclease